MNAILICPEHRPLGGQFHRMKPLALMPVLGCSLIEHALAKLARNGFKDVVVLASDRPGHIRQTVRDGSAWGLRVRVQPVSVEPNVQLAALEWAHEFADGKVDTVIVLDRCALADAETLWQSSEGIFAMYRTALMNENAAAQLTMREASPGVWISTKARVSSQANITGPAWIGANVSVREGARIGPHSVIEPGAFIDSYAIVEESWIGPDTYVGPAIQVMHSLAWGNGVTNWQNGSFLEVSDAFLLCDISHAPRRERRSTMIGRITALALMGIAFPLVLAIMLKRRLHNETVFRERRCILPPPEKVSHFTRTHALLTLEGTDSLLQRWPELWRVVRGDMALIGNRPLTPEAASSLRGDSARNWLGKPAGVFSLADAERVNGECTTEAIAYAAYFTARDSWKLRISILLRCLVNTVRSLFTPTSASLLNSAQPV